MLNKQFILARDSVSWNGVEVATLRSLTPNDVSKLLVDQGAIVTELFNALKRVDLVGVDMRSTDQIADRIMAEGPAIALALAERVPRLLAKILAMVSSEVEDPVEENAEFIYENFSLPLQFHMLQRTFEITFAGPDGFRDFVGNVMTLVDTVSAITNVEPSKNDSTPSTTG